MRSVRPLVAVGVMSAATSVMAAGLDTSSGNRRTPVSGLPDWSKAGFGGGEALPNDCQISVIITPETLAQRYGVKPNDGVDDTDGLYAAITDLRTVQRPTGTYALIKLPSGKLNLSHRLSLDVNYVILRGAGSDPTTGTILEFAPDSNTVYDVLTSDGARWDQANSGYSWSYLDEKNKTVTGSAAGGWSWPGHAIIQVGSTAVAPKYTVPFQMAPKNRKELFLGSVNYHFRNDTKIKGFMADQTKDLAGKMGTGKIYYDAQNTSWPWAVGHDVYLSGPIRSFDYDSWGVQDPSYYANNYMYQDWFTVTGVGKDADGSSYLNVDHPLRFDFYSINTAGGATLMENTTNIAKVMPIEDPVHHVGIENLYITQPMAGLTAAQAVNNYGNLAPERAIHGIVFRFARDSWVRGIQMYMVGSHPIATESARRLTIQDNVFDGAWNKGSGGNGYLRGSRVFDSVFVGNKLRNLRHFALHWSSMGNVVIQNDLDCDLNLHGGWEGFNIVEGNTIKVPYNHRSRSCTVNCGGEGTGLENGTWFPVYWSAGAKASKWAGATGPQNVLFRNTMQKVKTDGGVLEDFTPYYKSDGSLATKVVEFGWSTAGYKHLSLDGVSPLLDWSGNEQAAYAAGIVNSKTDTSQSLFLKNTTATTTPPASCTATPVSIRSSVEGGRKRHAHRLNLGHA